MGNKVWPPVEQYSKLFEAEVTPDQIKDIFTRAEKVTWQVALIKLF